jgi:hypothetical protein
MPDAIICSFEDAFRRVCPKKCPANEERKRSPAVPHVHQPYSALSKGLINCFHAGRSNPTASPAGYYSRVFRGPRGCRWILGNAFKRPRSCWCDIFGCEDHPDRLPANNSEADRNTRDDASQCPLQEPGVVHAAAAGSSQRRGRRNNCTEHFLEHCGAGNNNAWTAIRMDYCPRSS